MRERAEPEKEAVFMMAYAKALATVKGGSDRIFGREDVAVVEQMAQLQNAARDFECAAAILRPYRNSGNRAVRMAAREGVSSANELRDWAEEEYHFLTRLLDGRLSDGQAADQTASATSKLDMIWEHFSISAVGVTHAITAIDPTTGETGLFVITTTDREEFLATLSGTFGHEIEHGMKPDQPCPDHIAAMLYGFVSDPKWKSAANGSPRPRPVARAGHQVE
jgi:hypothetical protein